MSAAKAVMQTCDVVECDPRAESEKAVSQESILLIEDDEEAMLLVRYALQDYGNGAYRLEWANGLTSGLHRVAKGGIDLVLLDLGLPETMGAESYASLRKSAPDLPILVLTADTREQTEVSVAADGVDDYLVKDEVSGRLLTEAIRNALNANKRWRKRKALASENAQQLHWAQEKCRAVQELGMRLMQMKRYDSVPACGKAIRAVIQAYAGVVDADLESTADLFMLIEHMARQAAAQDQIDIARRLRSMMTLSGVSHSAAAVLKSALDRRTGRLDEESRRKKDPSSAMNNTQLAASLREILESVPGLF